MSRRETDFIIVTEVDDICPCDAKEIDKVHRRRGWLKIGFHFVITEDGDIQVGRELDLPGAHSRGYNDCSIGIGLCGIEHSEEQLDSLLTLTMVLMLQYPDAELISNPVSDKEFNAQVWWNTLNQT
jgi:N-acetylmuramoyl-L-alanine amidase